MPSCGCHDEDVGVSDQTALESQDLVVTGDRSELRLEHGVIVIHKQATTQARPTEVSFDVDQVRGASLETPRGVAGWLHVSVVGGSPPPPSGLAATGDPYTLPLTGRGTGVARRLVKMVERHVQQRGMPPEAAGGTGSSGVIVHAGGDRPTPPAPITGAVPDATAHEQTGSGDVAGRLRELADLHAAGALTDAEFEQAKARVLR